MNICAPIKRLTEDEIKDILKHKEELIISIHDKMYMTKKEMSKTDDIIEMASFPSSQLNDMPGGKGEHKDLSDVLLKYYKYLNRQKEEYNELFWILIQRELRIERVWMCFLLLDEPYYSYIKKLYVDNEKYETVERESGYAGSTFRKYRKEAIELIIYFYESDKSMTELMELSQKKLIEHEKIIIEEKDDSSDAENHQISITDFMEIKNIKNMI